MYELTKDFRFEAAHTLEREIDRAASQRIHGHSYRAEVTIGGEIDPATGMVVDLGQLDQALARMRAELDHRFLDEVPGLAPATLERLARFVWQRLAPDCPGLLHVVICRDSLGERCRYRPE
jgi:6-pyruvoyltetrahydropterin/6-carboxytetrahydropterin synthase